MTNNKDREGLVTDEMIDELIAAVVAREHRDETGTATGALTARVEKARAALQAQPAADVEGLVDREWARLLATNVPIGTPVSDGTIITKTELLSIVRAALSNGETNGKG